MSLDPCRRAPKIGWFSAVLVLTGIAVHGGCVQRRMTIRSNPPGAQVYVDNQEIGRTPVSTDFIYYGRRNIRLVKDGYETLTVKQPIWAPWYEWPGLAFISENVIPWEIRDERYFDLQMQPAMVVPSQSLLTRAEELRQSQPVVPTMPIETAPSTAPSISSPYAVPPSASSSGLQPNSGYFPPPAILNYPPDAGGAGAASPPTGSPPPSVDYGGRPVPMMP